MPRCISTAQRTRIDDAREFRQYAVACGLDDAAVMPRDRRIDEGAAVTHQSFERSFFVHTHKPRVSRHIGREDGS